MASVDSMLRSSAIGAPLLERDDEREELERLVAEATAGEGAFAVIEGPLGIGKTRLLHEAALLAARAGCACLVARAGELERGFAFGIARQLFEPRVARLPAERRNALLSGAAARAAPLFAAAPAVPPGDRLHSLMHGLYWLAANLAEESPLVLCIDDAHWADAASLRWLAYMANRVEGLPIAIVVTTRPREAGAEQELLDLLAGHPRARVLEPRPLSAAAVSALAEATLGIAPEPEFVAACAEATQGNPFFVAELLRGLAAERVPPTGEDARRVLEGGIPSVERSIMRRLVTLPRAATALARAVSVIGPAGDAAALARTAGLDADSIAQAQETLVDAAILQPGGREFVHPLVRAVVYSRIPAAERAAMHRDAARALLRAGTDADHVALHLLSTPPGGADWAAGVLVDAAESASRRGAPDAAARFLRRALEEGATEPSRCAILRRLGMAEVAAFGPDGVEHLRLASAAEPDPAERAQILLEAGHALFAEGRVGEAATLLDEALEHVDADDDETRCRIRGPLASIALNDLAVLRRIGGIDGLIGAIDEAGATDPRYEAALAWALVAARPPAARGAEIALRAAAEGDPADPVVCASAFAALLSAGHYAEAEAGWGRLISRARNDGCVALLTFGLVMRAPVLLRSGDVRTAETDVREVLDLALEVGRVPSEQHEAIPWLLAPMIDALVERDHLEEARELYELSGLTEPLPERLQFTYLLDSLGRLRLAEGRKAEAVALLRECGRRAQAWGVTNPAFFPWRSSLALGLSALGEREEAIDLCVRQAAEAARFGVVREHGMALRAHGLIAGGREGVELLENAASLLDDAPCRLEAARALVDFGGALRRAGQRSDARDPLRRGLDLARRCGARRIAALAADELIAAGAKPRRLAFSGVESLTPSELRICRMAAEGMSNREIAESLFLAEKTVEGHLRNAYRKLDVSARSQLRAALDGGGLADYPGAVAAGTLR